MVVINADQFATKRYIRSLVQGEGFNELDFLKQTSTIATADLRRTLNVAAEELQQELTALVNDEFEGFVKLFNDIGDVGENEFQDFESKVCSLLENGRTLHENAVKELELLEGHIMRLQRNIAEKRKLEFSQKLFKSLEHLSKLFNASSLLQDPLDLEIAAEIFTRLRYSVNAASGKLELPEEFVQQYATITAKFYSVLEDSLLMCLCKSDEMLWYTIASTYIRIGKTQSIIDSFTNEFWKARLEKVVSKGKYEEMKRRFAEKAVEMTFKDLLQTIREIYTFWFKKLSSDFQNQHLFIECVLGPTFAQLTKALSVIISPALPDIFQSNFLQSCKFIDDLVTMLTPFEIAALDKNEAFQSYARSWQLNVYFQLRFRDTAQALEDVLIPFNDTNNIFDNSAGKPLKHGMIVVLDGLCKDMATERIVLKPLRPKFFRLRIQCLSRASQWLIEQAEQNIKQDEVALSKAWLATWNCQQLLVLARSIFSEHDPLKEGMDHERTKALIDRFLKELDGNQFLLKNKLADGIQLLAIGSIERRQPDDLQPLNLIRLLTRITTLQAEFELRPDFAFIEKAAELVGQSRKAVANYRRLKSIMKEQTDNSQIDKETQQAQLCEILCSEVVSLIEFSKTLGQEDSQQALKLSELLKDLSNSN